MVIDWIEDVDGVVCCGDWVVCDVVCWMDVILDDVDFEVVLVCVENYMVDD